MSAQPRVAGTVDQRLAELIGQMLSRRVVEIVPLVDQILLLATEAGEIRAVAVDTHRLRFEVRGFEPFELEGNAARGDLRSICARLAKLCQESGHEFEPYGGEGTIRQTWKARWTNTMAKQEFTITAE